jgi:hypothetical protein
MCLRVSLILWFLAFAWEGTFPSQAGKNYTLPSTDASAIFPYGSEGERRSVRPYHVVQIVLCCMNTWLLQQSRHNERVEFLKWNLPISVIFNGKHGINAIFVHCSYLAKAVPQLRRLVADFSPRRLRFEPRSGNVRFVVDKMHWWRFSPNNSFPLPILIPQTAPHSSSSIQGQYNRLNSDTTYSHLLSNFSSVTRVKPLSLIHLEFRIWGSHGGDELYLLG